MKNNFIVISDNKKRCIWGSLLAMAVYLVFSMLSVYAARVEKANAVSDWSLFTYKVDSYARAYPYITGIVIKDYKNGLSYEYNTEEKFISASLIKLPIMCAVMQLVGEGELSFEQKLKLKRYDKVSGSGRLRYKRSGSEFTVSELVRVMIKNSDNTAAKMLTRHIGYTKMNNLFVDMGLLNTNISDKSFNMTSRRVRDESYTTPEDIVFLLDEIYTKQFVSSEISDIVVEILKLPQQRERLSLYIPDEFELAHKTGLLRGACHDAGLVFTPSGDYLICVMTEKNRSYRTAKRFISNIGRMTYHFI